MTHIRLDRFRQGASDRPIGTTCAPTPESASILIRRVSVERKTFTRRLSIVLAVFAVVTALGTSRAQATMLEFSFTDPEGDTFLFPGEVGPVTDVAGLFFTFDNTTGDYEITMTAFPDNPFIGDFIINANLFNPDTGATTAFPAFFVDASNTFFLSTPSTSITLSGLDLRLLAWEAGDRVAACEGSGGIIPEDCSGGLGHPSDGTTAFQSGVINFVPKPFTEPFRNIARDSFQSSSPATISVVAGIDHFLVYDAKRTKGSPKFEKRTVTLADQFDDGGPARVFKVKKVERLGNPADKNGEGINDPDTHYVSYKIKRGKGELKHVKLTGIRVINQFGEIILDSDKPDRLLVPSAKDLENPVEPLEPGADHFKCYKVKVTKGTPKFEKREVLVVDQFNQPALLKVKKPERLCNPVDKDGEGIGNADGHLLCYKVKRAKGEPKFEKIQGIHVNNQFGPLQLDAKKEKELCLPSEKDISGATPLDDDDDDD